MSLSWGSLLSPLNGSDPQVISRCLGDTSNWMPFSHFLFFKGINLTLSFLGPVRGSCPREQVHASLKVLSFERDHSRHSGKGGVPMSWPD